MLAAHLPRACTNGVALKGLAKSAGCALGMDEIGRRHEQVDVRTDGAPARRAINGCARGAMARQRAHGGPAGQPDEFE